MSWAGAARKRARRRRLHGGVYTEASTLQAGLYTEASVYTEASTLRLRLGVYTDASPLTVVAALDRVEVLLAHGARRGSAWLGGRRLSWSLDWRDTGARPRRGRWRHQHGALGDVLTPATLASMLRRLVMLLMARRAHQHGARPAHVRGLLTWLTNTAAHVLLRVAAHVRVAG